MDEDKYIKYGISDFGQYIAIFEDLHFEKYPIKEMAKIDRPLYIGEHYIYSTFSVYNDPERPKFSYIIYNNQLKKTDIKIDKWLCSKIVQWYYNGEWFREVTLSDPLGEFRTIRLTEQHHDFSIRQLEGIILTINDIKKFSYLKSWESYDLIKNNLELRERIKSLESEIMFLKKIET